MKRQTIKQVVPALIMAGAAAVPIATTVEILTHVTGGGSALAPQPFASVAVAPSGTSPLVTGASASIYSRRTKTYQGPVVNDPFGGVQANITVAKNKIANVMIAAPQGDSTSASINQQAVPLLQRETLQAQSARVHMVSGATYTSQAYARSLQAALDQARRQGNAISATLPSSQVAGGASSGTTQQPVVSVSAND